MPLVQISPYTNASLTCGYTMGQGAGLSLTSARTLPHNMQATLGWVVGPPGADGLTFSLVKRGKKYVATGTA